MTDAMWIYRFRGEYLELMYMDPRRRDRADFAKPDTDSHILTVLKRVGGDK